MHTYLLVLIACTSGLEKYEGTDTSGMNLESGITPDETGPIDSAGDGNGAPVADAGADAAVSVGQVVNLDGSGSSDPDGDALDYLWTITDRPGGSASALINATFSDPQFIPDVAGVYRVELVVSDGASDSAPDSVEITASAQNGDPVANAGSDQTVNAGSTVYLDGSGSSDPEGDPLVYAWTLTSRPGGSAAALSSSTAAAPTFVADLSGTYAFSLTVFDGSNYSSPDEVRVYAQDNSGGTDTGGCGCATGPEPMAPVGLLGLLLLARRRVRDGARPSA